MYAEVYLTLLTCCFSIDIYSFLYRTRVNTWQFFSFHTSIAIFKSDFTGEAICCWLHRARCRCFARSGGLKNEFA